MPRSSCCIHLRPCHSHSSTPLSASLSWGIGLPPRRFCSPRHTRMSTTADPRIQKSPLTLHHVAPQACSGGRSPASRREELRSPRMARRVSSRRQSTPMRRRAEQTASSKISTAKNSRIQFLIELQHRLTSEIYELLGQLGVNPTSAQDGSRKS